jgi:hypothetical protein
VASLLSLAVVLFLVGGSLACIYAEVLGGSWSDSTTTNDYFSFGTSLPVVMPMHTCSDVEIR